VAARTTPAQRATALAEIASGNKTVQQIAADYGVQVSTVQRWQKTAAATQRATTAATPLATRVAEKYFGGGGWAAAAATRIGQILNIQHKVVLGCLTAIARFAFAALVAVVLWYLLEVDGEELDRARLKWLSLNEKLSQLADDVEGAVEPLTKDGAPWNTDDQKQFANHIKAYVAEVRQVAGTTNNNADVLKTIIDAITLIFGSTLVATLALMVFVYVVAPLLATPAAPAAKAEQEAAGGIASGTIVAVINGVLAFLGTIGPFLIMMQQQMYFQGNRPNVLGTGDQFKDIHITWKVNAVK
jgi:hypothetical protein